MLTLQPDNKNASKVREFAFSDDDFNALRTLVKAHTDYSLIGKDDLPAGVK